MLDLTKPVQTREGNPFRILCTDAPGDYPVTGYEIIGKRIAIRALTLEGRFSLNSEYEHEFDLIQAPVKRKIWLNVNARVVTAHLSFDEARLCEQDDLLKRVMVEVEV